MSDTPDPERPPLATGRPTPWWRADMHEDRRPFLLVRTRLKAALRAYFEAEGFLEVEASILQRSPGNETHLHAFRTERIWPDLTRETLYLHTSPEFSAKKLIAAGERRIVDFARVFRNRERSPIHANEFTMVEWYRAGETYDALMKDCARILAIAAEAGGRTRFAFGDRSIDPFAPPERVTLAEAFATHAGIDLLATLDLDGTPRREDLAEAARRAGIRLAEDDSWSDIFSRVLVEKVEPNIGRGRATILCEYPAPEAALARRSARDPRVSERFELYACGLELANAFGELTDPVEQRARFEADMDQKERLYGERYPIDEDLLEALSVMPPTSGIALGFERLAMLASGATRIDQVIWTPGPV
ncbi:MAG: EF-P lysine aminoacylase EpmA [Labrys sp. (in: a-proteobacteria)]